MGTIRKWWRKLRRWFDREARKHFEEAKQIIRDVFGEMKINIRDLFDDAKREKIADEIRAKLRELRGDLTDWIIEWALESLWEEVLDGLKRRII